MVDAVLNWNKYSLKELSLFQHICINLLGCQKIRILFLTVISNIFLRIFYWEKVFSEKDDCYHETHRLYSIFTLSPITFFIFILFNYLVYNFLTLFNPTFRSFSGMFYLLFVGLS